MAALRRSCIFSAFSAMISSCLSSNSVLVLAPNFSYSMLTCLVSCFPELSFHRLALNAATPIAPGDRVPAVELAPSGCRGGRRPPSVRCARGRRGAGWGGWVQGWSSRRPGPSPSRRPGPGSAPPPRPHRRGPPSHPPPPSRRRAPCRSSGPPRATPAPRARWSLRRRRRAGGGGAPPAALAFLSAASSSSAAAGSVAGGPGGAGTGPAGPPFGVLGGAMDLRLVGAGVNGEGPGAAVPPTTRRDPKGHTWTASRDLGDGC